MRSDGSRALRCSLWCARTGSGSTPRPRPILQGFDFGRFLAGLKPAASIHARHTVGLVDALTRAEPRRAQRIDDGLPESLEEVIAAYGHRYFKLKVAGKIEADIDRLRGIAAVLDAWPATIRRRSTATSSIDDIDEVTALWRRIGEEPRLARLEIVDPVHRAADRARPRAVGAGEARCRTRFRSRSTSPTPMSACFRAPARSAIAASRRNPARASIAR